ncbi:MAG: CHC2 zinc finger domain-containing protein [Rhizobiaceae bacterium]
MPYVDFAALKQRVAIEEALPLLGLKMKQRAGQWRVPCPVCRSGGERALVVTPAKSAFYCFGGRVGGDVIALAAHILDFSMKDAAFELDRMVGKGSGAAEGGGNSSDTVPEERAKGDARSLQPLTYLQLDHEAVTSLGVTAETCQAFGAGYAPKGIMRGRLAIPIHDRSGVLIAYCGHAIAGESPGLTFPKGFRPSEVIFNAHRLANEGEGSEMELILARDPLEVMVAWQNGVVDAVSFLTQTIQPPQLGLLSKLMNELECSQLHMA